MIVIKFIWHVVRASTDAWTYGLPGQGQILVDAVFLNNNKIFSVLYTGELNVKGVELTKKFESKSVSMGFSCIFVATKPTCIGEHSRSAITNRKMTTIEQKGPGPSCSSCLEQVSSSLVYHGSSGLKYPQSLNPNRFYCLHDLTKAFCSSLSTQAKHNCQDVHALTLNSCKLVIMLHNKYLNMKNDMRNVLLHANQLDGVGGGGGRGVYSECKKKKKKKTMQLYSPSLSQCYADVCGSCGCK